MELETVTLKLPRVMLCAAADLARHKDVTIGQIVRDLLEDELSRRAGHRPTDASDQRLIGPLRACLGPDFASATDWGDLLNRLQGKGFVLRAAGGGLALHDWPRNRRLCTASDLGHPYSDLMRRFRAPFPDHPHAWRTARVLEEPDAQPPDLFSQTDRKKTGAAMKAAPRV